MGDEDETPIEVPQPAAIAGRLRRHAQAIEDRDGGTYGRRPRTAHLDEDATPRDVHDEITDVHRAVSQVLAHEEFSPAQVRLVTGIMEAAWKHVESAERRRGTGDLKVLAASGVGEDVARRLRAVEDEHVRLTGIDGDNGRIGNIEATLGSIKIAEEKRAGRILAVVSAIGVAIGGSVFAVVSTIRDGGRDDNRLDRIELDHRDLADDFTRFRAEFWRDRLNLPGLPALPGDDQ